ncbi:hypothetical protein PTKIN_Ptkin15bG0118200 [Pterospermum kingtungense]
MFVDENPLIELTDEDATNLSILLFASIRKAVEERIVPTSEIFETNRRDIIVAMMKNYPLLLCKFMLDKAKIPSLVEIILYMNLELYSLKRQEQNFRTIFQPMKDAFFKHGEKNALRSCVQAIKFCSTESQVKLQDFARDKLKELEDKLIDKLKSTIKKVIDGEDGYFLLVNLERLYELQLSRPVSIEDLYEDVENQRKKELFFSLFSLYNVVVIYIQTVLAR